MKRLFPLAMGAALLALALVPVPASAAPATATFAKTQDWGGGFEGKFTLVNGTTSAINGWTVEFDLPAPHTITASWDSVRTSTGQHHVFRNPSWASTLPAGATVTFGFNGSPGNFSGGVLNCTFNGTSCSGGPTNPGAPGVPGNPTVTSTTNSSISLSWGASTGTVTGYRVYEGTTLRTTVTGTSATITGVPACTTRTFTVAAFNGVGESARSGPASGITTGCPTGSLPRHFLTGYWHNFVNPATELRLSAVPNDYDVIAVAFAEAASTPGAVTFAVDP
ncbi:MAG: cellulose binding domain-containing protein, partial [Stackebrandtia sp.]